MSLLCQRCDYSFKSKIIDAGSKGLSYSVNEDRTTCNITGIGTCTDTDGVIPVAIDGYAVISVNESAFANCTQLQSIIIP